MPYAIENAIFQWEEGERRLRTADDPVRRQLFGAESRVYEELRRRLGGKFTLAELDGDGNGAQPARRQSPQHPRSKKRKRKRR